ncbi:MAG: hypothetical protein M3388_00205 [Acidobacteriota bacterium]|nr:hypothetical protein [Acidobacteriota bacterium]
MIKQFLSTIFLFIVSVATVLAQGSVEEAAKSARDRFSDVKNRSIELERMKRDAAKRPNSGIYATGFPEIKEDFEKIQKIADNVFELTSGKSSINYAAVLKLVSEINQRAVRLRSNLFSAEPKQKKDAIYKQQTVFESQDIQTLLKVLDKSITSFVQNSLFQNANLVNSNDSLNAQNNLETVIKISFSIKEKAKKLKKENSKNNQR